MDKKYHVSIEKDYGERYIVKILKYTPQSHWVESAYCGSREDAERIKKEYEDKFK